MANIGELSVDITADVQDFEQGLDRAERRAGQFESRVQRVAQGLTRAGKTLTVGLTTPIVALGGVMVKAASDFNESLNAVNVVFGDSADTITSWGKTATRQVGLTRTQINRAATVIGSQLQNMGFAADDAAEETINLTKRAADMASVFGGTVDDALTAIQAGLRGEIDPLERFGVGLSDARVQSKLLADGMAETTGEITDQDKILGRLALLYEDTEKVAGDFVNTSDDLANSFRNLQTDLGEVAIELGEELLPIAKDIVSVLRDWVERFSELTDQQKKVVLAIGGIAAAMGPLLIVVGQVTRALPPLITGIQALTASLAAAGTAVLGPIGLAVGGLAALAAAAIILGPKLEDLAGHTGTYTDEVDKLIAAADAAGIALSQYEGASLSNIATLDDLAIATKAAAESEDAQREAAKKTREILSEMQGATDNYADSTADAAEATGELVERTDEQKAADELWLETRQGVLDALDAADEKQKALGDAYDANAEKTKTLTDAIEFLIENGWSAETRNVQALIDMLGMLNDAEGDLDRQRRERSAARNQAIKDEIAAERATRAQWLQEQVDAEKAKNAQLLAVQKIYADQRKQFEQILQTSIVGIITAAGETLVNLVGDNEEAAFFIRKAFGVTTTIINTAIAVTEALAKLGPFGPPAAAALAALGAAQTAVILSQQPPKPAALAEGGVVLPTPGGTPALIGEAGSAEAVIPLNETTLTALGDRIVDAMSRQQPTNLDLTVQMGNERLFKMVERGIRDGKVIVAPRGIGRR